MNRSRKLPNVKIFEKHIFFIKCNNLAKKKKICRIHALPFNIILNTAKLDDFARDTYRLRCTLDQ